MNKIIRLVILSLAVVSLLQATSTIDNPCGIDPTSNQPRRNRISIPEEIDLTLVETETAYNTCLSFKESLRPLLPSDCDLESWLTNIRGLTWVNESILTTSDVFARTLRRSALNVTILYNVVGRVLNAGGMHLFQRQLRDVRFSMSRVVCRIDLTTQAMSLNFNVNESERYNETKPADYEEFSNLQQVINQDSLSIDNNRRSICVAYTVVSLVQRMMMILIATLEVGQAFYGA